MITKYNSTRFVLLDSALLTIIVTFWVFWDIWWAHVVFVRSERDSHKHIVVTAQLNLNLSWE